MVERRPGFLTQDDITDIGVVVNGCSRSEAAHVGDHGRLATRPHHDGRIVGLSVSKDVCSPTPRAQPPGQPGEAALLGAPEDALDRGRLERWRWRVTGPTAGTPRLGSGSLVPWSAGRCG